MLSDVAAGQPSCPASGPAPAGVRSRPAYRNNNADPTNSAAKNPLRIKVPKTPGGLHGEPNPMISAITATNACASAVANNARDIPCGRKRATMAPMIPTASTPTYIELARSSSDPMMPTAPVNQTRRNAAPSATPTAARYAILPAFLTTSTYVRPVPKMRAPAKTKSNRVQGHSANKGSSNMNAVASATPAATRYAFLANTVLLNVVLLSLSAVQSNSGRVRAHKAAKPRPPPSSSPSRHRSRKQRAISSPYPSRSPRG